MKENGENMWLNNLPAHTPPEGMWERIETRMDNDLANEQLHEQLAALPEHEPPFGLWARIEQGLVRRRFIRLGLITSGIAATLLLAFMLKGVLVPEPTKNPSVQSFTRSPIATRSPEINTDSPNRTKTFTIPEKEKQIITAPIKMSPSVSALNNPVASTAAKELNDQSQDISIPQEYNKLPEISFSMLPLEMKPLTLPDDEQASLLPSITTTNASKNIPQNDTLLAWLLARTSKDNLPPPPSRAAASQPKGVSIGFNWLPEPMSQSDNGSSAFQTFAVMAQLQTRSIDLRTGLGISYQSAPMEYRTDYASFNSAFGNGRDKFISGGDTLSEALVGAGSIDISGKERSSFLYYTIGAGKRIFSGKRLSTTLQAGGGVSLLLGSQHSLRGPIFDAFNSQSNTFFGNTESHIPEISRTHFDLFTGFDFSYRLHKRWSLSIEPTLKYYFNPLYNGNKPRSFSTGLRTGILFKL